MKRKNKQNLKIYVKIITIIRIIKNINICTILLSLDFANIFYFATIEHIFAAVKI